MHQTSRVTHLVSIMNPLWVNLGASLTASGSEGMVQAEEEACRS